MNLIQIPDGCLNWNKGAWDMVIGSQLLGEQKSASLTKVLSNSIAAKCLSLMRCIFS